MLVLLVQRTFSGNSKTHAPGVFEEGEGDGPVRVGVVRVHDVEVGGPDAGRADGAHLRAARRRRAQRLGQRVTEPRQAVARVGQAGQGRARPPAAVTRHVVIPAIE